jgi:hypothetical protein
MPQRLNPFCKLCDAVNEFNSSVARPIASFYDYWTREGRCLGQ